MYNFVKIIDNDTNKLNINNCTRNVNLYTENV